MIDLHELATTAHYLRRGTVDAEIDVDMVGLQAAHETCSQRVRDLIKSHEGANDLEQIVATYLRGYLLKLTHQLQ